MKKTTILSLVGVTTIVAGATYLNKQRIVDYFKDRKVRSSVWAAKFLPNDEESPTISAITVSVNSKKYVVTSAYTCMIYLSNYPEAVAKRPLTFKNASGDTLTLQMGEIVNNEFCILKEVVSDGGKSIINKLPAFEISSKPVNYNDTYDYYLHNSTQLLRQTATITSLKNEIPVALGIYSPLEYDKITPDMLFQTVKDIARLTDQPLIHKQWCMGNGVLPREVVQKINIGSAFIRATLYKCVMTKKDFFVAKKSAGDYGHGSPILDSSGDLIGIDFNAAVSDSGNEVLLILPASRIASALSTVSI